MSNRIILVPCVVSFLPGLETGRQFLSLEGAAILWSSLVKYTGQLILMEDCRSVGQDLSRHKATS